MRRAARQQRLPSPLVGSANFPLIEYRPAGDFADAYSRAPLGGFTRVPLAHAPSRHDGAECRD